jgi:hypothetical protein
MKFLPYGLAGGTPARPTRNVLVRDGVARSMPGKLAIVLRQGDRILHEQPGGGGFGDPLTRDPAAVAADVRNEKITPTHARDEYGVVIDPETLTVDTSATLAARAAAATRSATAAVSVAPRDEAGGAGPRPPHLAPRATATRAGCPTWQWSPRADASSARRRRP